MQIALASYETVPDIQAYDHLPMIATMKATRIHKFQETSSDFPCRHLARFFPDHAVVKRRVNQHVNNSQMYEHSGHCVTNVAESQLWSRPSARLASGPRNSVCMLHLGQSFGMADQFATSRGPAHIFNAYECKAKLCTQTSSFLPDSSQAQEVAVRPCGCGSS